ncbi:hypothetical protein PLANTIT3_100078 [Plantibacter sp. T3]|nr:hypothetical protein PLANTIT3_100078 [Plantibacter sp. T3]
MGRPGPHNHPAAAHRDGRGGDPPGAEAPVRDGRQHPPRPRHLPRRPGFDRSPAHPVARELSLAASPSGGDRAGVTVRGQGWGVRARAKSFQCGRGKLRGDRRRG